MSELPVRVARELTCFAVIPDEETANAEDNNSAEEGEGEDEAYCGEEGDVLCFRLELGVLVKLQGAHGFE